MWQYIVRVVVCNEDFDFDSVEASAFYGPYRTKEPADRIADAVTKKFEGKDSGVLVFIHLISKSDIRKIVQDANERVG